MARQARKTSQIGVYTVVLRGKSDIFANNKNKQMFFSCLDSKVTYGISILAYAVGKKDAYLVVKENEKSLSEFMRSFSVKFASAYNKINLHFGKVFYDRYLSEPLNTAQEVLQAIKSIHLLETNRALKGEHAYVTSLKNYFDNCLIDASYVVGEISKEQFYSLHTKQQKSAVLKVKLDKPNDEFVINYIYRKYNIKVSDINKLSKNKITSICEDVLLATKASARQIGRLTALPLRFLWSLTQKKNTKGEKTL